MIFITFLPSALPRTCRQCLIVLAVLQSRGDIQSYTTRHNLDVCVCVCVCVCMMISIQLKKAKELKRNQGNSKKTCTSASLTMLKLLTVWITTNWKILKEMGIPDYLTCLLRNLYADREATVRTLHGTTDWFKIWKRVWHSWRRKWQPTPVFLPGESHGRRSLVGCSPWGRTESDTTEAT